MPYASVAWQQALEISVNSGNHGTAARYRAYLRLARVHDRGGYLDADSEGECSRKDMNTIFITIC